MAQSDDEHKHALAAVAAQYEAAKKQAEEIMREPRRQLAEGIIAAYADGAGLTKAEIIRAINYVWTRQWIDQAVLPSAARKAAAKKATHKAAPRKKPAS